MHIVQYPTTITNSTIPCQLFIRWQLLNVTPLLSNRLVSHDCSDSYPGTYLSDNGFSELSNIR